MLTQTERPADIVRRRLEQAGYDEVDGLNFLGAEDMSMLMKFVYKSYRFSLTVTIISSLHRIDPDLVIDSRHLIQRI